MLEIERINIELNKLIERVTKKKQELIKAKLKNIQENGILNDSKLSKEEMKLLCTYLIDKGNSKSAMIQKEWRYAEYPEETGIYDYKFINCYLLLGYKVYSVLKNDFIDRNSIERDFNCNDLYCGRKTIFGSKRQLIEPLKIDELFEEEKDYFCKRIINSSSEIIYEINEERE